jgi:uncharacterized membrane protein
MTRVNASHIAGVLIALMFVAGLCALAQLPPTAPVAVHFDMSGRPDSSAPAYFGLFILPAAACFVLLLRWQLPLIDPRGQNLRGSRKAFGTITLATVAVVAACQFMLVAHAIGMRMNASHYVEIMLGGFFIVIGNVFGKLRWNYTVGIRTPWTLADERVWDQTHRFAGWVFVISGACTIGLSLLLPASAMPIVVTTALAAILILPTAKSYLLWRARQRVPTGK